MGSLTDISMDHFGSSPIFLILNLEPRAPQPSGLGRGYFRAAKNWRYLWIHIRGYDTMLQWGYALDLDPLGFNYIYMRV